MLRVNFILIQPIRKLYAKQNENTGFKIEMTRFLYLNVDPKH
jgi:hypothetical protein